MAQSHGSSALTPSSGSWIAANNTAMKSNGRCWFCVATLVLAFFVALDAVEFVLGKLHFSHLYNTLFEALAYGVLDSIFIWLALWIGVLRWIPARTRAKR
jgi:putative Mn2+ efflux pump MntP